MGDDLYAPRNVMHPLSRSATPSFFHESGTPNSYSASLPPMSEYSNFHDELAPSLSSRSASPYLNVIPPGSGNPEAYPRSQYLRRTDSFGSGHSNQSRRSSLNSSSGSMRHNKDEIRELRVELAILWSENQAIKTEKDTIMYVLLIIFLCKTLIQLTASGRHLKFYVAPPRLHPTHWVPSISQICLAKQGILPRCRHF